MAEPTIKSQIIAELDTLTPEQQAYLLSVLKGLQSSAHDTGNTGAKLLAYMDDFSFAPGAIDEIMAIIDEGCEQIDWDSWQ